MFLTIHRIFILLLVVLFGCQKKEAAVHPVMALQQMNELATVEYVVTKVIRADDNKTWYKIGDRKILMNCRATLTAGINLAALTKEQVQIDGKTIRLSLPHAELVSLNIQPADISVVYESIHMLRQDFSAGERNGLAIQAEKQLRASVADLGILQTAEANATLFISNFLHRLGYEQINISFDTPRKKFQ